MVVGCVWLVLGDGWAGVAVGLPELVCGKWHSGGDGVLLRTVVARRGRVPPCLPRNRIAPAEPALELRCYAVGGVGEERRSLPPTFNMDLTNLHVLSASEATRLIRDGVITSEQLVRACL